MTSSIMATMLRMSWTALMRDKVALMLTFALPIVFFSVFVGIFGQMVGGGNGGTAKVALIVVDEDQTDSSQRFVMALQRDPGLKVTTAAPAPPSSSSVPGAIPKGATQASPYTRQQAMHMVKNGEAPVAAIIPKGFGEHFGSFDPTESQPIELLTDKQRDPVAYQMVSGLMQRAAMVGAPDLMIQRGLDQFEKYAGGMTPRQREMMNKWLPMLREEVVRNVGVGDGGAREAASGGAGARSDNAVGFGGLVQVNVVDVQREHKSDWEAFVAFQCAQTAVMFLLFSMAGAAGTLLDEQDSGTLERVLTSNVGMGRLLMSKWMFVAMIGVVQLTVMFLWAWKPFGLDLWSAHHVMGFAIMTVLTAAAGASLGMVLATACRTRGQLSGVSTIVILIMSAIGGSMFPRFLMSDTMKQIGLVTFNAWALDGYRKVFYDNAPLLELWPQVLVLAGITVALLFMARLLARRWEAA
jgi:ABC-2 type transport system permease protein